MDYFNKSKHKFMYLVIGMMFIGIIIYVGLIFLAYDGSFSDWSSFFISLIVTLLAFVFIYFILFYLSENFKSFKSFSSPKNQTYPEFVFKTDLKSRSKTAILLISLCLLMIISSFFIYNDYRIITINFTFFISIIVWIILYLKRNKYLKDVKEIILNFLKF